MSFDNTTAKEFFERAKREAKRYGEDPWVFLRELVQNSRDAQARCIEILTETEGEYEKLTCRDDGHGMDQEAFSSYFLRLYASSKEKDGDAIGFFGVGFWSVLLYGPERIQVTSTFNDTCLAFEIDCVLRTITPISADVISKGTEITLWRKCQLEPAEFLKTAGERLGYYAGHVRPARDSTSLELHFNGDRVDTPFPLPRDYGRAFKTKHFDGVLGFGKEPMVRIYKGGLLVRDLSSLNEIIPSRVLGATDDWGLFPVVHINIEGLVVLMDRRKVFEDPLLHQAVTYCARTLQKLHRELVRNMFPMGVKNRLFGFFDGLTWQLTLIYLMTFLSAAYSVYMLWIIFVPPTPIAPPRRMNLSGPRPLDDALHSWRGSIIDSPLRDKFSWDFGYEGPKRSLFRMGTFSRYDPKRGFFPERLSPQNTYPDFKDRGQERVRIHMGVSSRARQVILPLPPGFVLVKGSLIEKRGAKLAVFQNRFGEPLVRPPPNRSLALAYDAIRQPYPIQPPPVRGVPYAAWPKAYRDLLDEVRGQDTATTIDIFARFIHVNYMYTNDPRLANVFHGHEGTWLEKTVATGAGDCDILNGLMVLLLQASGRNAFLSVGLVGVDGRARRAFHAWTRYYDNGWENLDISRQATIMRGHDQLAGVAMGQAPNIPAASPQPAKTMEPATKRSSDTLQTSPFWFLLLLPVFLFLVFRNRGKKVEVDESAFVTDLFQHYFRHGGREDHLQLRFRPVFPLLNRRLVSLFEIQKFARRGLLLGSQPDGHLLPLLHGPYLVLDLSSEVVEELRSFLPGVTWLEELDPIANQHPSHPLLAAAETVIRQLDPGFRVYQVPHSDVFLETRLALRGEGKSFHLLLGENHALFQRLISDLPYSLDLQVFEATQILLNKTTFYLNEKDLFLEHLAGRNEGWARKLAREVS